MMNLFTFSRVCWFFLAVSQLPATDLSPAGLWKTIDDKTGRARGIVRIYEQNGELFGKIVSSVSPEEAKEVCSSCSGNVRTNQWSGW